MARGKIFTLSGVSGSGKSFLKDCILDSQSNFIQLMTATTRKKRSNERDGVDKIFLSEEEFKRQEQVNQLFFANKLFGGNWYAYRMSDIEMYNMGKNLVTEISYDYVHTFKSRFENVVSIYILPYDIEKTIHELKCRNMAQAEFEERVDKIRAELKFFEEHKELFEFTITNDYTENVCKELKFFIQSVMKGR